jgi:diacylglycerol kinase (ATP)
MTADVALIVNPMAGKGRAAKVVAGVARRLRESGANVAILVGRNVSETVELGRKAAASGVDAVVALGGDGTAHLALNAVAGSDTPLGIIPTGTGNDLANSLGLPKDPIAAADVVIDRIAADSAWLMDAVRVGTNWFGGVLGAGFDSRVTDRANRMSWPHGRLRYNLAILAELRVFAPIEFRISLDDEDPRDVSAMLVAVGNARSYGAGMKVCPDADLTDGLLDVMVLGPVSKPEFLKTFPKVYRGTHVSHPQVSVQRAKVVTIEAVGVSAYGDGEYMSELPITCECVPGAVRVLA